MVSVRTARIFSQRVMGVLESRLRDCGINEKNAHEHDIRRSITPDGLWVFTLDGDEVLTVDPREMEMVDP